MNCCIPDGVDINAPVKSEVIMERTWSSPIVGVFSVLYVIVVIALAGLSMASLPTPEPCVGSAVWAAQKEAILKQTARFFLESSGAMSEMIEDNPQALVAGIGLMFGSIFFLLLGFRFIPKAITWCLAVVNIVVWCACGVWLKVKFDTDIAFALFAAAAIMAIVLLVKKTAVNEAAMLFKAATYCIFANPSMLLMTFIIQCVILLLGALMVGGIVSSALAGDFVANTGTICKPGECLSITIIDSGVSKSLTCAYQKKSWASGVNYMLSFSFTYMMLNFKMLRLYMVSVVTALWYWETDSNRRAWKACLGMKWAMSYGYGVVASAAIIVAIVDQITRQVQSKVQMCLNCCNPLFWIFYIVVKVFKDVMYALATFSMIMGAITGEGFCLSANRAYFTLKGRFSTLFVVGGVSRTILFSFANMISFAAYLLVLQIVQPEVFNPAEMTGTLKTAWQMLIIILGMFATSYAIVTFLLVSLLAGILPTEAQAFLMGMFCGALVSYLMNYFAEVFLDVVNALFAVAEIDRKNGVVPGENCAEGTPGAFASYYYTEMSKAETTAAAGQQVATGTAIQQGAPVEGVAINAGY